jgi:nitrate reductase NapE component
MEDTAEECIAFYFLDIVLQPLLPVYLLGKIAD